MHSALAATLVVALVAAACGGPAASSTSSIPVSSSPAAPSSPPPTSTPSATAAPSTAVPSSAAMPQLQHVWIVVFENRGYDKIVGSSKAPTINDLIARGALATEYRGVARPSQPNYLALFSGSTQGVTDNDLHDISAPTIADQLESAGLTWRENAENVPSGCFTGSSASGGRDGEGTYERKHAPAISFTAIADDPARCANIADLTAFDAGAANVTLIVPNMCHSMHDCSIAQGDAWLAGLLPRITESDAFTAGGVLVVTFDEGESGDSGGGHLPTIILSPRVAPGTTSDLPHDHYSLLRTIEDGFGLPCLGEACQASPMSELFSRP